jgi:hypothetical protein
MKSSRKNRTSLTNLAPGGTTLSQAQLLNVAGAVAKGGGGGDTRWSHTIGSDPDDIFVLDDE